jgi:hypothetical protein
VGKSHDYVCICAGRRARPANGGLSAIRGTGKAIPANELKTYAEALAQYHLRPEAKFLNGDFCDRGRTERRHVVATQLLHIGKEANKWEEQHFLGEDEEAEIEYGVDENGSSLEGKIRGLCEEIGERRRAKILGEERQKRLV